MKKMFLMGAFALLGLVNVNAQETGGIRLGVHAGLPVGNYGDAYSFTGGADLAYVYPLAENFKLGVATGYSHSVGKTIKGSNAKAKDFGIIPVGATAQYNFDGSGVFLGFDFGYAFSTEKGADGSLYYQPKLGYTFANKHDLYFSYKGFKRNNLVNYGSVNLGYAYTF